MKFGILLYRGLFGTRILPGGLEAIIGIAKKAERLGYDSVWLTDESWWTPDPIPYAAILAERTRRIKIGILGMNPYVRHPLSLALSFHTFGELAGKRAIVGVCAGSEARLRKLGLIRANPLDTVNETVEVMRRLVHNRPLEYSGRHVKVEGISASWVKNDLTIYICANGPKMLELAGKIAEGVVLAHFPPSYARWGLKFVREGLASRRTRGFDYCVQPIAFVSDKRESAFRLAKRYFQFLPPPIALRNPRILVESGFTTSEARSISGAFQEAFANPRRNLAPGLVEKVTRSFAITGTPEEAREKVKEYERAGITHIIVGFTPEESILQSLTDFKKKIAARV